MNLRELRIKSGLTQQDVSERVGITYQAYAHYEKKRRAINLEMSYKLSRVFNMTIDDFYKIIFD